MTAAAGPDALVARHEPAALWHAARLSRRYPWLDPDDVRSCCRLALVKAARGFDPARGTFTTYLGDTALHEVQDLLRSHRPAGYKNYVKGEAVPETRPLGPDAAGVPDPHDAEAAVDDAEQVAALLARLDPRQAEVVRLRFREGRTLDEVGARLGVSKQRVLQIERGALDRMRATRRAVRRAS